MASSWKIQNQRKKKDKEIFILTFMYPKYKPIKNNEL